MKTFEQWKEQELQLTFGIQRVKKLPILENWLQASHAPTAFEAEYITKLKLHLQDHSSYWNEDEVKFHFIGPLVALIQFMGEQYNGFNQRYLFALLRAKDGTDVELKGKTDMMVATGRQDPIAPYFFIHEYKPEKRRERDPLGQLLAAMLASQVLNEAEHPMYGCYVVGRLWFFVVLDGLKYSVSLAYDATQEDIFRIFSILKTCKDYIEELIAQGEPVFP